MLIYSKPWRLIEEQDRPEVGTIFACKTDGIETVALHKAGFVVYRSEGAGDRPTPLGLFWSQNDAVVFCKARERADGE